MTCSLLTLISTTGFKVALTSQSLSSDTSWWNPDGFFCMSAQPSLALAPVAARHTLQLPQFISHGWRNTSVPQLFGSMICSCLQKHIGDHKAIFFGFAWESLPFSARSLSKLTVQTGTVVLIKRWDFISLLSFLSDLTLSVIALSFKAIRVRFRSPYIGRSCPWRIHGVLKPM